MTPCFSQFPTDAPETKYNHTTFKLTNPSLHATIDVFEYIV